MCVRIAFLFEAEQYFIICMYHILSVHSSVDGHLGCIHLVAIVYNAITDMDVQIL